MLIKTTVEQIIKDEAILKIDDKISFALPLEKLPPGINKGSALTVEILTEAEYEEKTDKKAKDILNELLDVTP